MSKESVPAKIVSSMNEAFAHGPGAVLLTDYHRSRLEDSKSGGAGVFMILPGDIHAVIHISSNPEIFTKSGCWQLRSLDPISIHPSINSVGVEQWHGWLRDGRFQSV